MQIGYLSANPFASDAEQFTITPEQQAAQRLHAAAPELLAALLEIDSASRPPTFGTPNDADRARIALGDIARAALAKANG